MSEMTKNKLEKMLKHLIELGLVEKNGDKYKMTDDGRELYKLHLAFKEKKEEMEKKILEQKK